MTWRLTRFCYSDMGTFGIINTGQDTFFSVERPWLDNKPSVSCIPIGNYPLNLRHYYRGGYEAIELTGVAPRTHILIHIANTMWDVQGCIGVGLYLGCISVPDHGSSWAVLHSKDAFQKLMSAYADQSPERIIIENQEMDGIVK